MGAKAATPKMPTSPTDPESSTLVAFADRAGGAGTWLRVDADGVAERGDSADTMPAPDSAAGLVLAVPGEQVAIHWLALAEGLSQPQAAAAARLMLADAAPEPIADMHVAVGRPEGGLTPAALVPMHQMVAWLGLNPQPERIVPASMLLAPPADGFARRSHGSLADYRGEAAAFTLEPELAAALIGDAPAAEVADEAFAAGLPSILAAPLLDLRQGPFARRRQWAVERGNLRRVIMLALVLALLTLAVQVVTLMRYAFAADRVEAEAATLASGGGTAGVQRLAFGAAAGILFDAIRSTPNAELVRLEYRPDGSLVATVQLDNQATLPALAARVEAGGLATEQGAVRSAGGRPTAELTVRAR